MRNFRKKATRLGAFLLCIAMLSALFASCERAREPAGPMSEGQRLHVVPGEVVYTKDFAASAAARMAELAGEWLRYTEGVVIAEDVRETLAETVQSDFLPILCELPVTQDELERILTLSEIAWGSLLSENTSKHAVQTVTDCYQELVRILDTRRAGYLIYEFELLYLNGKIVYADHRYEMYGYPWYLEDATRYRAQRDVLTLELGREVFAEAAGIAVFGGSVVTSFLADSTLTSDEKLLSLGDLLLLMQKQSSVFANASITAEQWSLLAELFFPMLTTSDDTLLQAELAALLAAEYPKKAAAIFPEVFEFYDLCVSSLSANEIEEYQKSGDTVAKISVICRVLSRNESAFLRILDRFAVLGATNSAAEARAIEKAGLWNDYQGFLAVHIPCTATELAAAVAACANGADDAAVADLNEKIMGFFCGVAPCLCYVLTAEGV